MSVEKRKKGFLKFEKNVKYGASNTVCSSKGPQQQTGCRGFAAVGPAGRRYRSPDAQPACGRRMRAVPRSQRT